MRLATVLNVDPSFLKAIVTADYSASDGYITVSTRAREAARDTSLGWRTRCGLYDLAQYCDAQAVTRPSIAELVREYVHG